MLVCANEKTNAHYHNQFFPADYFLFTLTYFKHIEANAKAIHVVNEQKYWDICVDYVLYKWYSMQVWGIHFCNLY